MFRVPHQRELFFEFDRLHGLPPTGLAKHDDTRRQRSESRDFWIPHNRPCMFLMSSNNDLGRRKIRSQHYRLSVDEQAHDGAMQPVSHQWKLFPEYFADRLWKLGLSLNDLATNKQSSALHGRCGVRGGKLFELSYHGGMGCRFVRPQRDWFHFDRHAHVADADSLRVMPHQQ
jgi:hypothetical protein